MDSIIVGEPQWKYCMTFGGRPASAKMEEICSTMVGVCGDGFKMTVLPERRAGMREFTRIKYGYYNYEHKTMMLSARNERTYIPSK